MRFLVVEDRRDPIDVHRDVDLDLLAGTSVGDNSLYDSGVLPSSTTSAIVSGLPQDGSTVHVTLRWSEGGGSSEKYYTYIAFAGGGGGGVPMMVSPLDGATLTASSETSMTFKPWPNTKNTISMWWSTDSSLRVENPLRSV